MDYELPRRLHARPVALWWRIARLIIVARFGYFLILPVALGTGLAVTGQEPKAVLAAMLATWVFSWVALATHEFSHVALALVESYGFAGIRLQAPGGGLAGILDDLRWTWYRLRRLAFTRGIPLQLPAETPERGYIRVVTNMVLSSHSRTRIALAGVVIPLLLWAVLALPMALLLTRVAASAIAAAVLVATLTYVIAHPFFSGLIYSGRAYSDLGYAANFMVRSELKTAHPIRLIGLILRDIARYSGGIVGDVLRYVVAPRSQLTASAAAGLRPKRSCLSWVYKRAATGEFTDRVLILAPFGMALLKRITATPRGRERQEVARLLTDAQELAHLISCKRVYLVELNDFASRAWELADGRLTMPEIADTISREKSLPFAEVEPALERYFSDLHEKYLLNLNWPTAPVRNYPLLSDVVFDFGGIDPMVRAILARG